MIFSLGRAAPIAGIVIIALMIAGTISVTVDNAWLWGLLSLFAVSLFARRRRALRPWEQRWWWERAEPQAGGCCIDAPPAPPPD